MTTVTRIRAAAIVKVKVDVGNWTLTDPDAGYDQLAQAALRMCELIALTPAAATETASDPTYLGLIKGRRKRFGIASASPAWLDAHPPVT